MVPKRFCVVLPMKWLPAGMKWRWWPGIMRWGFLFIPWATKCGFVIFRSAVILLLILCWGRLINFCLWWAGLFRLWQNLPVHSKGPFLWMKGCGRKSRTFLWRREFQIWRTFLTGIACRFRAWLWFTANRRSFSDAGALSKNVCTEKQQRRRTLCRFCFPSMRRLFAGSVQKERRLSAMRLSCRNCRRLLLLTRKITKFFMRRGLKRANNRNCWCRLLQNWRKSFPCGVWSCGVNQSAKRKTKQRLWLERIILRNGCASAAYAMIWKAGFCRRTYALFLRVLKVFRWRWPKRWRPVCLVWDFALRAALTCWLKMRKTGCWREVPLTNLHPGCVCWCQTLVWESVWGKKPGRQLKITLRKKFGIVGRICWNGLFGKSGLWYR